MALSGDRNSNPEPLDFADYAQEFLRRNSEYRRQFARLATMRNSAERMAAARRIGRRWGLVFPV